MNPNDPDVIALSKAIFQRESGGNFNAVGDAGTSHGAGQWQDATWKAQAKDVLGDENAAMTPENQKAVIQVTVAKRKAAGLNPAQIAAEWNSGKPDGWENKVGDKIINGQKIHYDVPAYVKAVTDYYHQYKGQSQSAPTASGFNPTPFSAGAVNFSGVNDAPNQPAGASDGSFVGDVGKTLGTAGTGIAQGATKALTGLTSGNPVGVFNGALQGVGAAAGAVGGLFNNVAEHTPIVGGIYKGAEGLIGQGVGALANTDAGKGVINFAQQQAQAHPEIAADLGAVGNIATAVPLLRGLGVVKDVAASGISNALKGSAEKVASEALGAASPKLSEVKAGIKQGIITQGKHGPVLGADPAKQLSAKYLADEIKAGNVPKNASHTQLAIHAESAADTEAQNLENLLSKAEVQHIAQPEDLQTLAKNTIKRAGQSATSGENPAQTLLKVFVEKLPQSGDITALDVLKARRAVGRFISENRGDWTTRGVLTGFKSARNAFWDESRKLLVRLAPDVPVLPSLEKQSALYRVADYLAPKVKSEITNASKSTFMTRHPVIRGLVKGGVKAAAEGTGIGAAMRILQ